MSHGEWPLLPDELWLTAWGCLPHESLAQLGLTGRRAREWATSEPLWYALLERDWGVPVRERACAHDAAGAAHAYRRLRRALGGRRRGGLAGVPADARLDRALRFCGALCDGGVGLVLDGPLGRAVDAAVAERAAEAQPAVAPRAREVAREPAERAPRPAERAAQPAVRARGALSLIHI